MTWKIFLIPAVLAAVTGCTSPRDISVIPVPESVTYVGGGVSTEKLASSISEELVESPDGVTSEEGYILTLSDKGARIEASGRAGLFYGRKTLEQICENPGKVRACVIRDNPRFEYRGIMLDVSRHWFNKEYVMKQMDAMARYKLNRLHLHLTDAAGWRIEIKKYPLLTELASRRPQALWKEWWYGDRQYGGEYGGYFTAEDVRELVAYAAERHIEIIPEIEMPAHSEEALTAYPEYSCTHEPYRQADFCPGNEGTYKFLENVLTEVMEMFPSRYIHIGGDEAGKASWKSCPLCLKKMREEGYESTDELQGYLIRRINDFVRSKGRHVIAWDEVLDDEIPADAAITAWRGSEVGAKAISGGHRTILCPTSHCYLDYYQDAPHTQPEAIGGFLPLVKVYSFEPDGDAWGVQGNLWAEYIPTPQQNEYMLYPRLLAIAEVGWSLPEHKNYEDFRTRALKETKWLRAAGYNAMDLSSEFGERPESLREEKHLAAGCKVNYAPDAVWYPKYAAAGDGSLTDGIRGGWSYTDGKWQGFIDEQGIDVTIDLGQVRKIGYVGAGFMQICEPGVFFPGEVIVSASADSVRFTELTRITHEVVRDEGLSFRDFEWSGNAECRYVRYQAHYGSFGGFLFTDEIIVR